MNTYILGGSDQAMCRVVKSYDDIDLCSTKERTILDLHLLGITELEVLGRYCYTKTYRKFTSEVLENLYEFFYVESGEQTHFVGEQRYSLVGGDLLVVRPGEV
ncbi:MAG: AraC family ligand binding domain-containing protein, partial [Spirochaetota bacterium]